MSEAANCCKDKKIVTKLKFLEEKADNFKNYLLDLKPDDEARKYIETFEPQLLVSTITNIIVPIVQMGGVEESADEILKHLTVPDGKTEEVKKKICRYIHMFNDVLLKQ
jgi:hypothetical protein